MKNIGKMDDLVTLKYLSRGANNKSGTWTDLLSVWAEVRELEQFRTSVNREVIEGKGIRCKMRHLDCLTDYGNSTDELTSENRINYDGDDYDIVSVSKVSDFEIKVIAKRA